MACLSKTRSILSQYVMNNSLVKSKMVPQKVNVHENKCTHYSQKPRLQASITFILVHQLFRRHKHK